MGSVSNISMSGNSSRININGMSFEVRDRKVFVNGKEYGPIGGTVASAAPPEQTEPLRLDRDGKITGTLPGDLNIMGPGPVTLIVEGASHSY